MAHPERPPSDTSPAPARATLVIRHPTSLFIVCNICWCYYLLLDFVSVGTTVCPIPDTNQCMIVSDQKLRESHWVSKQTFYFWYQLLNLFIHILHTILKRHHSVTLVGISYVVTVKVLEIESIGIVVVNTMWYHSQTAVKLQQRHHEACHWCVWMGPMDWMWMYIRTSFDTQIILCKIKCLGWGFSTESSLIWVTAAILFDVGIEEMYVGYGYVLFIKKKRRITQ